MTKIKIYYPLRYKKHYKELKNELNKNYVPCTLESFTDDRKDLDKGLLVIRDNDNVIEHEIADPKDFQFDNVRNYFPMFSLEKVDEIISNINTNIRYLKLNSKESISTNKNMVVSKTLRSNLNIPSYPTSTRDGYALFYNDLHVPKKIIGKSLAGTTIDSSNFLEDNTAIYVATGGTIPKEYNCVVMIENVEVNNGHIRIKNTNEVFVNSFIRQIGSDIKKDEILVNKGTKLDGFLESLLIQGGVKEVPVNNNSGSSLTCTIYTTGNEVIDIGDELLSLSDVYNTNLTLIDTLIKRNKLDSQLHINVKHLRDFEVKEYITKHGIDQDITIFIGGAAVGEHDHSREILAEYTEPLCTQVNLMPGRPFGVGTYKYRDREGVFFSLAGNPVSCCVGFMRFIVPYIYKRLGLNTDNLRIMGELGYNAKNPSKRNELQRVSYKDGKWILTTENSLSSNIKSLINCDGLLLVKPNEVIEEGSMREILLFHQDEKLSKIMEEKRSYTNKFKIGILTASDRASKGLYKDESGEKIKEFLAQTIKSEYEVIYECIEDDYDLIIATLVQLSKKGCCLILTTGGTGPSIRDNTILAVKEMIHKELPGFGELMRSENLKQVPTAILSAQTAGIYYYRSKGTLIVNCPGSPKSIYFSLNCVWNAIPYCIELMGHEFMECEPKAFRPNKK